MTAALSLEHKFIEGDPAAPVLLLLHGTGGGPDDLVGLGQALSPVSALLAPRGAVTENGMARWFRRLAEGVFDHTDVTRRADQLADFILAAREHHGLQDRRLVAVGFSNGANIGAATALLRPDALSEAALFAAVLPLPDPPQHDLSATRVLLSNGRRDPMAPAEPAAQLAKMLRQRSADVREHWHPGGHHITTNGVARARAWLDA